MRCTQHEVLRAYIHPQENTVAELVKRLSQTRAIVASIPRVRSDCGAAELKKQGRNLRSAVWDHSPKALIEPKLLGLWQMTHVDSCYA